MPRIRNNALALLAALGTAGSAATIPYQGLATDATGKPKPDATYTIGFALYGGSTSANPLWSEGQVVSVRKGLFSVLLGSGTDIPDSLFQRNALYLGLTFSGESELSPRLSLGLAPWAVRAHVADTAAFARTATGLDSLRKAFSAAQDTLNALSTQVAQLTALLSGLHRQGQNLYFDSVNLNVRNGLGRTDTINGLGNLVVGYNALRGDTSDHRTGSHTLVVGDNQSYTSYGGFVAGQHNAVKGNYSSVGGGYGGIASGAYASIGGGYINAASGAYSFIGGGGMNSVLGSATSISGGSRNTVAAVVYASIAGGVSNYVSGNYGSIAGGNTDTASGAYATVGGGYKNKASGQSATVSGGESNNAAGTGTSIHGSTGLFITTTDGYGP